MRLQKKALIIVLAFAMVFTGSISLFDTTGDVYAASKKKSLNILFVGDSTTMGYGCKGSDDKPINGYLITPKSCTYAKKLVSKLKKSKKYKKVVPNYFLLGGMRNDEVRALLDKNYYDKVIAEERALCGAGNGYMESHFIRDISLNTPNNSYEELQAMFVDKVKKANVIVLDNNMSNMGADLMGDLINTLIVGEKQKVLSVNNLDMNDSLRTESTNLRGTLTSKLGMLGKLVPSMKDTIDNVIDLITFAYTDGLNNLDYNVKLIKEINPTAKIYVMGLFNPVSNINVKLPIAIGGSNVLKLASTIQDLYNNYDSYAATKTESAAKFKYIKYSKGVKIFIDSWASGTVKVKYKNKKCVYSGNKDDAAALDKCINSQYSGLYVSFPEVKKSEKNEYKIAKLLLAASKAKTIDAMDLLGMSDVTASLTEKINAYLKSGKLSTFSESDLVMLKLMEDGVFHVAIGCHPSAKGYQQKYTALAKYVK